MAKTLDDLQTLLTSHGYACERMVDVIVATTVATKIYKNREGTNSLQVLLTIDRPNNCVAVEALHAFDLRDAAHKEATLACLLTATGHTPLLRPSLEPEGNVRLRVDCPLGKNGARVGEVLQAVALLPTFVDAWYPQVTSAMEKGTFDPSQVVHLNLSRLGKAAKPHGKRATGPQPSDGTDRSPKIGDIVRAAAISEKPGADPNRLKTLQAFHDWLDGQRGGEGGGNDETPDDDNQTPDQAPDSNDLN